MKKIIFFFIFASLSVIVFAQNTGKTPSVKPATLFKNINDSFSYALGVQVASFYKQQGVKKINSAMLARAINDIYTSGKSMLSQRDMDLVIMGTTSPDQYKQCKANLSVGEKFLKENKTKPGVMTTPSGLEYEVIKQGTGVKPTIKDTVVCHYKGTLLNGTAFDDSYARNAPATFALTNVIKGWTEALQLMAVGSKYKLYVPCELSYGVMDYGSIPGGSTLVFEVELLDIKK
jgi:FKBP-type peptidyl-prolyl cis-trans isomerase FklB